MIKKNTTAIFIEDNTKRVEELEGGIPLSVGEIIIIEKDNVKTSWKVIDKKVEYNDSEQIVNITYTFNKSLN